VEENYSKTGLGRALATVPVRSCRNRRITNALLITYGGNMRLTVLDDDPGERITLTRANHGLSQ
jgi:hypothetical protein